MDDELKHILYVLNDGHDSISRTMRYILKMDNTKITFILELDHLLYQVYKMNVYTRALKDKLENG